MDPIEHQLYAIVREEFGLEPGSLTRETRLPDLGDSLDWYSLMSALEDGFGIQISHEDSLAISTVEDVLRLVKKQPFETTGMRSLDAAA
jgi:acyl carrier protein